MLLMYVLFASPMVYFKIKVIPFLISILALFSLTTSYLLPTLYKIKAEKSVTIQKQSLLREEFEPGDNINLDFGKPEQSVELGKKEKVMENYFKQYQGERSKKKRNHGEEKGCSQTFVQILNIVLLGLIACCYCLIVFNFAYHTVKPYVD